MQVLRMKPWCLLCLLWLVLASAGLAGEGTAEDSNAGLEEERRTEEGGGAEEEGGAEEGGGAEEEEGAEEGGGAEEEGGAEDPEGASDVIVLTQENFDEVINSEPLSLVEFYAPWCGHCKRLAPEYEKAAGDLKPYGIQLATVDATTEESLATQFGVSGYPTLKIFRKGRPFDYTGPRERYGIVEHMIQQSKPASQLLQSHREVQELRKTNNDAVVIAFPSGDADPMLTAYNEAANLGRDGPLQFGHAFDPQLAGQYGLEPGSVGILMPDRYHSKFEPAVVQYEGSLDGNETEVYTHLLVSARPLVGLRDRSNEQLYDSTTYPLLVAYLEIDRTREGRKEIQHWRNKLLPVAAEFQGLVTMAMSDEEEFHQEMVLMGLEDWGEDVAVGLWAGPREKYRLNDELSDGELREFLKDYLAGDLQPYVRSQAAPRKTEGPVAVVVGSTFRELVYNPKKDVLVEFFAPWCRHCKALEPKYKKLAKKFKKNKKLVVAKFDAASNDAPPEFDYRGFPTIFLVPAGKDSVPLRYEGSSEVEELEAFLRREAKFSLGKQLKDEL